MKNELEMRAFHDDESIKQKYLERVRLHRQADELVKGQYWEDGKGCAVGCTIHSGDHAAYETELGIPEILARLEDRLFERLPNELAMTWPERFLEAVPVSADLSKVWYRFAQWLLIDPNDGVIRFNNHQSIKDVAALFKRAELGDNPSLEEWRKARNAAYATATATAAYAAYAAAAAASAYAAAAAYDAYAADAAAYDAYAAAYDAYADAAAAYDAYADAAAADAAAYDAYAAAYAAYAAAYDAYAAAREASYIKQSEKLLELLRST